MCENSKEDALREAKLNLEWIRDNFEELQQNYDKQWIVIEDQKVVDSSKICNKIFKNVQKYKTSALIEFINSEQMAMFL
jgi:hypothetical protein